jgi:hypothetical protein
MYKPTPMSSASKKLNLTPKELNKVYGYMVVGLVLIFVGIVLIIVASVKQQYQALPEDFHDPVQLRELLQRDRQKDAMFNGGIAILTSGLLLFFGFAITEFMAGVSTPSQGQVRGPVDAT